MADVSGTELPPSNPPKRWSPPGSGNDATRRLAQCWRCKTKYECDKNAPLFPCEVCSENILVAREP